MALDNQFIDGMKIDSKKHLVFRPAYAKIDDKKDLVLMWDHGPNYNSVSEMLAQRKSISPEKMHAGLHSNPGLQCANRGISLVKILDYKENRFLVATCKRNEKILRPINGYFGNGIGVPLENEEVPQDINVADSILRTAVIEDFEEFNAVYDNQVLRAEVQITEASIPISFAPFENKGFSYSKEIKYKVKPFDGKLECLINLNKLPVAKVSCAEDQNPFILGKNIGVYFAPFFNCFQIVASVQTNINELDFLFQTEDKYRDETGMDTFLYRDGLKLIKLDDKGKMVPEVYEIKEKGNLKPVPLNGLLVSEAFVPNNPATETVIAKTLPFNEAMEIEYQN